MLLRGASRCRERLHAHRPRIEDDSRAVSIRRLGANRAGYRLWNAATCSPVRSRTPPIELNQLRPRRSRPQHTSPLSSSGWPPVYFGKATSPEGSLSSRFVRPLEGRAERGGRRIGNLGCSGHRCRQTDPAGSGQSQKGDPGPQGKMSNTRQTNSSQFARKAGHVMAPQRHKSTGGCTPPLRLPPQVAAVPSTGGAGAWPDRQGEFPCGLLPLR